MISQIKNRISKITSRLACKTAQMAKFGRNGKELNNQIILLTNIRNAVNSTWTTEMIEKTDCLIKKYE